jgi:hypothetical protein
MYFDVVELPRKTSPRFLTIREPGTRYASAFSCIFGTAIRREALKREIPPKITPLTADRIVIQIQ